MHNPPKHASRASGQSLVETVIFLPFLLLIFMGLFYMKGIVNTKMRAIEAARYVAWENSWVAREGLGNRVAYDGVDQGVKSDATLKAELEQVGLGEFLFRVRNLKFNNDSKPGESLGNYKTRMEQIPGRQNSKFAQIPDALKKLFGLGGDQGGEAGALAQAPGQPNSGDASSSTDEFGNQDTGGIENQIWDLVGSGAFALFGFMSSETKWADEDDHSVLTAEVVYHYDTGGSKFFPGLFITEKASLLSHPWNIKRSNDEEEHHRLAGDGTSCEDEDNLGHIFDLWLLPTGAPKSARGALRVAKCPFVLITELSKVMSFLSFGDLEPVRIPNGTTKEYPELDLPAGSGVKGGSKGSGNGTGGGLGGGNSQPPKS